MFLIKGDETFKEWFEIILSSVNQEDLSLLVLLNKYGSLKHINLKTFQTINRLKGRSKDLLTDKYELMKLFQTMQFQYSLPSIVFSTYKESNIHAFLERGTKHKFLKASDGFSGIGIRVVDSIEEIYAYIKSYTPTKHFKGWILQDALEDIATFKTYKFHLRIILIITVRNGKIGIYIGNYHNYILSAQSYNVGRLKEEEIYDTHRKRNNQTTIFPMEPPDGWTHRQAIEGAETISILLRRLFKEYHSFQPDWNMKNGYELLGVDIVFNKERHPYILEINDKVGLFLSQIALIPEIFHLGLGGSPMKLFTLLYGSSSHVITPFTKPLTQFYNPSYKTVSDVHDTFQKIFNLSSSTESDNAYFLYQTKRSTHHTRRAKSKSKKSKTLKRGSRR